MVGTATSTSTDHRHRAVVWALLLVAALPVVRMTVLVLDGTHLPYNDYWLMMNRILRPSGGLDVGELFTFQNEHPVIPGQIVFWLNARVGSGSNIALGLMVIAVAATQLFLIHRLVKHTVPTPWWLPATLTVVASSLLFTPHGVWNFYVAMSGLAWLVANVFVLAALWAQTTERRVLATVFAVLASISYGTGIVVWVALLIAAAIQDRRWLPRFELVIGLVITGIWYVTSSNGKDATAGLEDPNLVDIARTGVELLGALIPAGGELFGWALVLSGLALALWGAVRAPSSAPWVGLLAFGLCTTALISEGRVTFIQLFGLPSRYASLAALTWIAWSVLLVMWARQELGPRLRESRGVASSTVVGVAVALVLAVAVSTVFSGQRSLDDRERTLVTQARLAIALRFDLMDGARNTLGFGIPFPRITRRLMTIGHHPFDGRSVGECGMADRPASDFGLDLGAPPIGTFTPPEPDPSLTEGVQMLVIIPTDAPTVDCILVLDGDATVVGAGHPVVPRPDAPTVEGGYHAIAPAGQGPFRVHVVFADGSDAPVAPVGS